MPLGNPINGGPKHPNRPFGSSVVSPCFHWHTLGFRDNLEKKLKAHKGEKWSKEFCRPAIENVAIIALLSTLIVLFCLNGQALIQNPELIVLVSIPLILGSLIIVGINLLTTKYAGLKYREGIVSVIIGSSSHFEIAIATAISLYGLGSQAALGTTMGLFWEVPMMLSLVYLGKKLNKRNFWRK